MKGDTGSSEHTWQNSPTSSSGVIPVLDRTGLQTKNQMLESCRSQKCASRTCPFGKGRISTLQLPLTEAASQEMLPAWQHVPEILGLMQRVFSHPEAIYWHIRRDCCGFCFVYRLANEVFVCVSASARGRNLQFIMLVLTLLHLQPKHKQRLHRNLMGG